MRSSPPLTPEQLIMPIFQKPLDPDQEAIQPSLDVLGEVYVNFTHSMADRLAKGQPIEPGEKSLPEYIRELPNIDQTRQLYLPGIAFMQKILQNDQIPMQRFELLMRARLQINPDIVPVLGTRVN